MKYTRGRPKENENILVLEYTQIFKEHTGEKFVWKWDLSKSNGPISVTISDPQYYVSETLLKEIDIIESRYTQKTGQRKPRITKEDHKKLDELKNQLENEHYRLYPDDRKTTTKTNKTTKKKI